MGGEGGLVVPGGALVRGQRGGVGGVQLAHRQHQDVLLLLVEAQLAAGEARVLQLALRGRQLAADGPGHALLPVHPVGGHLGAHVVVQRPVGVVSQHLLFDGTPQCIFVRSTVLVQGRLWSFWGPGRG